MRLSKMPVVFIKKKITKLSRKNAKILGFKRYYTGKMCKNGHAAERRVSDTHCQVCEKEKSQRWEINNPDYRKQCNKKYREDNKSHLMEYDKQYRADNKEGLITYREDNKKRKKEYDKQYRLNNLAKLAEHRHINTEHKKSATPKWNIQGIVNGYYHLARMFTLLFNKPYVVDHVIPLKGKFVSGLNVHTNLQILTNKENMKKSNKFAIE